MAKDFSWLNLTAFSIDELLTLEGLITKEYETRRVWVAIGQYDPLANDTPQIEQALRPKRKVTSKSDLSTGASSSTKAAPRYRHPSIPTLTWTGKGRKPTWVREWQAGGGSLDALVLPTTP